MKSHGSIARARSVSALLIGALLAAGPALSLTMQRVSLASLTKSNGTILTGKIVDAYSYWNSDGTWIVTDFKVSPEEVIKGAVKEPELTLTMLGGRVGETTVLIPGGPSLELGKSYLFFVQQVDLPGAAGSKTLSSYTQSVFDIVPSKDGPRAASQAALEGMVPDADGKTSAVGGSEGLGLEELKASVRSILSEQAAN